MELRGIDVSAYNSVANYAHVAEDGIRVAIMRITERGNVLDPTFEPNYRGFGQQKILRGVYKYCYALDPGTAEEEARRVLEVLNGRKLEFPVFYDLEWNRLGELGANRITAITRAFREKIIEGGYRFGIYCNTYWYRNVLDTAALPYDYWLAAYPYQDQGQIVESLRPPVGIGWQYSSKGRVPGITGYVDLDVFYKDYADEDPGEGDGGDGSGSETGELKDPVEYTVRPGDTLYALAQKYRTTISGIALLNDIPDVNLIYVGQKLTILPDNSYAMWVGACTGNGVRVRSGPGLSFTVIQGYPYLNKGNLVAVTGEKRDTAGVLWYQVLIANKYPGYVRHDYISRV